MANKPTGAERRARKAAAFQLFAKQFARKAQKGVAANDRAYDHDLQDRARRMDPIELDRLLHGDDD